MYILTVDFFSKEQYYNTMKNVEGREGNYIYTVYIITSNCQYSITRESGLYFGHKGAIGINLSLYPSRMC